MKTIIRASVIALALTGAAASTMISAHASTKITVAKLSAMPIPCCAPGDPNGCGIYDTK